MRRFAETTTRRNPDQARTTSRNRALTCKACRSGKPSQMSPTGAAVPLEIVHSAHDWLAKLQLVAAGCAAAAGCGWLRLPAAGCGWLRLAEAGCGIAAVAASASLTTVVSAGVRTIPLLRRSEEQRLIVLRPFVPATHRTRRTPRRRNAKRRSRA